MAVNVLTRDDHRLQAARHRASIDLSCRGPVLAFCTTALFWLLVGSALALIASIKLHSPYFLTGSSVLTFGRVRMAHLQAVALGWSSLAAMAACLWLMCRLSRVELTYPRMLYVACALWNIATTLAVGGILLGDGTSVEWLDAPVYAQPFFVAGVGLVAGWVAATFRRRQESHVYVTQWYILAA
ncbi:MAG: cbb3-type cytochrome c oxidase subunit I, partial [Gemmataceae bacterium]|nr:cbb3-type cytochrome c oxidase subunit I [Gemmataceae bacterium]